MLWHKGRCADLIVEEVFDKKVAVPDLLVIGLIVVYRSFLPSFNLPFVFCLYAFMCISSFPVFFVYLCLFSTASSFSILHLGSPITSLYSLHTPLSIFYSVYFTPLLPPSLPLPPSVISSPGLWARAAPTPTCWTCRAAPTRNECVAARCSTPRSCTKTLRWPERWSSTCLTWRWRRTRRNTRSCRCSASRPTAPVSDTETDFLSDCTDCSVQMLHLYYWLALPPSVTSVHGRNRNKLIKSVEVLFFHIVVS